MVEVLWAMLNIGRQDAIVWQWTQKNDKKTIGQIIST